MVTSNSTISSPSIARMQSAIQQLNGQRINQKTFEKIVSIAEEDQTYSPDEIQFIMTHLKDENFESRLIPDVAKLMSDKLIPALTNAESKTEANAPWMTLDNKSVTLNDRIFYTHSEIRDDLSLEEAIKMTSDNHIDEIILKDKQGKLHLVSGGKYGDLEVIDDVRANYRAKAEDIVTGQTQELEVVHMDDEVNTFAEGFKEPWSWAYHMVSGGISSAMGQGITTIGTGIGGIWIGQTMKATEQSLGSALKGIFSSKTAKGIGITLGVAAIGLTVAGVYNGVRAMGKASDYNTLQQVKN